MTLPENHLAHDYDSCYDILYPSVHEAPNLVVGSQAKESFTFFPFGKACTWASADGTTITKHFGHWQTSALLYGGATVGVLGYLLLVSKQRSRLNN